MILTELEVDAAEFEARTGWAAKPEGMCKGSVCVPLPGGTGGRLDVKVLSERLGMPLIHDADNDVYALGPSNVTGRALMTADMPDLVLPDVRTGEAFDIASLRGSKVVLVAWASW
jgi:hypothetical protein